MRSSGDPEYCSFLLEIGNGSRKELKFDSISSKPIEYLDEFFLPSSIDQLEDTIILTSKNIDAEHLNKQILSNLPGEEIRCRSVDTMPDEGNNQDLFPLEFLHKPQMSGMPLMSTFPKKIRTSYCSGILTVIVDF